MNLSSAKIGVVGVLALIVVGIGFLCFMPTNKPTLRLVLLSATNDVQTGTSWGVFRLENRSTNYMGVVSGFFQERTGLGWTKVAAAYDPRPGATSLQPPLLLPGALTFQTRVPSGDASHRLVLEVAQCDPLPVRKDLAYRVGTFLLSLGLLPQKYQQGLLSNSRWPKTKPFRVSSPNQPAGGKAGPAVQPLTQRLPSAVPQPGCCPAMNS